MTKARNITLYGVVALTLLIVPIMASFSSKTSAAIPYINERVDTDSSGSQVTGSAFSGMTPSISQDGRYVAFGSSASNLVSGDTNGLLDVFVKDRQTGAVVRANTSSTGAQMVSGSISSAPRISANGRYVGFIAYNPGLISGYGAGNRNLYVKDLQSGAITLDSISSSGTSGGNAYTNNFDISADGHYVVFRSSASNLVEGDTNGADDVFLRDRATGTTTLVSAAYGGGASNGSSGPPSISCDGGYVAYPSAASNLVSGDTNGFTDVFLVNLVSHVTTDVTLSGDGGSGSINADFSHPPQLSCDGTTLIMSSYATNLVSGDTNGQADIFAYDTFGGSIEKVTISSSGTQDMTSLDNDQSTNSVSYDGRYVVFSTNDSSGLVSGDTNGQEDVYLRDRKAGTTQILSKRTSSSATTGSSYSAAISKDGKYVVYLSDDTGLVSGDTNNSQDVFVSQTGI